jgi:UDP-N-acetylmuramate dehydrogenase
MRTKLEELTKLQKSFPNILENEPLRNHCTFRAGGPADYFYELRNIEELPDLIELANKLHIPIFLFGMGTNTLFLDGGFRGLCIKNMANQLEIDDLALRAASGTPLMQIIKKSTEDGLTGLEPLYGVPGTIGGAIYGNAGVPNTEISQFLKSVRVFSIDKGIRTLFKEDINFDYRTSSFKINPEKEYILEVTLQLKKGDTETSREMIKKIDEARRAKQPAGFTCGSWFKNPSPDKPAGMLIDQAGLKGYKVGDAQISEKHGNFFMNLGNAKAADLLGISKVAKVTVKKQFDLDLQEEVRIIGE